MEIQPEQIAHFCEFSSLNLSIFEFSWESSDIIIKLTPVTLCIHRELNVPPSGGPSLGFLEKMQGLLADFLPFFLNILWKSGRTNYFIFIGHLKLGDQEGARANPLNPLWIPHCYWVFSANYNMWNGVDVCIPAAHEILLTTIFEHFSLSVLNL